MSSGPKITLRAGAAALLTLAALRAARADSPTTTTTVNISGSTAFKSFFLSPGSTNDWIDVNNDGISGFNANGASSGPIPFVQQLAPNVSILNGSVASYTVSTNLNGASNVPYFSVQYRGTGSVAGLVELVNYALAGALPTPTNLGNPSYLNRTTVSNGGSLSFTPGPGGPIAGGFPTATPLTSIDAAVIDVAVPWTIQGSATATASWNLKPTQAGYGQNSLVPFGSNATTGTTNMLPTLSSSVNGQSLNLNIASPNSKTVYSTTLGFAPISVVANHGTGLTQVTQTQLQFLYVTGRMADGTNLVAATRDVGSGTRNGAMNSVGVDPSFGSGENIGNNVTNATLQQALGASFQPTNLDATGTMEAVVGNDRLAVGYESTTNGVSDQASGKVETLSVKFDLEGGTDYVRPTASTLINNNSSGAAGTGYRMGGIENFATVGDPLATTINANFPALNSDPQMANTAAAAYIRNIYESLASYQTAPNSSTQTFSPAQTLLSSGFLPIGALDQVPSTSDGTAWISNSAFSIAVATDAGSLGVLNTGAYGSGAAPYGLVSTRENLTAGTYSDGQTLSYRYFDSTGALFTVAPNTALNLRNAIAGDFNNDGQRNINDIPQLVAAAINPVTWAKANNSGQVGSGLGNAAIPELLGDFNGDGNFDKADVRYFADGLAVATTGPNAGHVDRKAGFVAVDTNASSNFFGTTLKTGKPYAFGDSRGDIAGSATGPTPGAGPTGSDGIVDAKDIDYTILQIKKATGQSSVQPVSGTSATLDVNGAYSTLLTRATSNSKIDVRADLSADMNGDLMINKSDLDELVQNVLGTQYGDVNLDGKVDGGDLNLLLTNFNQSNTGWAQGNFLGTATVDGGDLNLLLTNFNFNAGFSGGASAAPALTSHPVPEPASLALIALGAGRLIIRRRRR